MANLINSFIGNLNNEALEISQNSEVVNWLGNQGWNSSFGGDYRKDNFLFTRQATQSGVTMNGRIANTLSAYWACVQMIASDIAKLPLNIYEDDSRGNKLLRNNHPLYQYISISPDGQVTAQEFWETYILMCLTWGNGYAIIGDRNRSNGQITGLQGFHPNQVCIKFDKGVRYYQIFPTEQDKKFNRNGEDLSQESMMHLHGPGDGFSGWPVANFAKEALGISLSLQSLQSSLFANGMNLGGVLTTQEEMQKEHRAAMAAEWTAKYGGAANSNKTAVLDKGLTYQQYDTKAVDSEVLESRKFQVAEVARYFRVPLHKLGISDASTFNNVEQENLKYVTETLMPWITRIQNLIQFRLFPKSSRFYAKFDTKDLILADAESKAKFWKEAISSGIATPNQGAQDLDLPTYSAGNQHYIPANNLKPVSAADVDLAKSKEELKQLKESNGDDKEEEKELVSEKPEIPRDNPPKQEEEKLISFDASSIKNIFTMRTLIEDRLRNFVSREVKFNKMKEDQRSKFGDDFDEDKFKEQKELGFYSEHKNVLRESLATYFEILNMPEPSGFVDKWADWKACENWSDKKAFMIANDFILHYTGVQDYQDCIFDYEDPTTGRDIEVRLVNGILECS